ncbi:hypothetical protein EIP91_009764 [Steccherinum ochraceum]|uniref:SAP domain-containing protein n=1 Tax=Steccherinum ochraceum TaxID=92696 RepID=A0A4R0RAK8_9APHY|nr:hypothetical protein EIP91_009764 [Steccherinum ochraceum]
MQLLRPLIHSLPLDQASIPGCMACDDRSFVQVRDAYCRLTHKQLQLFCSVRSLPITGSVDDLATRLAHHDVQSYPLSFSSSTVNLNGHHAIIAHHPASPKRRFRPVKAPDLPVELMADIMDHLTSATGNSPKL